MSCRIITRLRKPSTILDNGLKGPGSSGFSPLVHIRALPNTRRQVVARQSFLFTSDRHHHPAQHFRASFTRDPYPLFFIQRSVSA